MFTKENLCSFIIVLFHLVGLYGFTHPALTDLFIALVPFHLLLMLALLIVSGYDGTAQIRLFATAVFFTGFMVEVVGVNTGLIFGSYTYGETLGLKIWETPILIGVNWLVLVYSTGVLLYPLRMNKYLFALFGAILLVGIDFLIEPVAIRYDYWSWNEEIIPFQNYVGWFVVSFLMFILFTILDFKKRNSSAVVLFVSQVLFFIILNKWGS
ncbi:carotenoid biosynthesis protein [Daejeonella lutea]|uniref:Putative membrane protein n=1 Tax=Daejeonella lutea TaxID=572036 RepID=A0A1T5CSJ4_9SPHI|nr:carotenoid biosynthesis protein [Daejeonella lutea]SKB62291.1 putative membrane protein [Daejeonella lutea]